MSDFDPVEKIEPKRITIPYAPRPHFIPVHQSKKRWKFVVAHRRCGKSVFITNELGRSALTNPRRTPFPRYGYVAPSFAQAKDLIWGYCKQYYGSLPGVQFSESELTTIFPNGARLSLYGGATGAERMRGLYFDGIAMDEYAMLNPDALNSIIRPALSDYKGFGIFSGTSNGQDHFYELKRYAEENLDEWDLFDLKVSDTNALDPEEVSAARRMMSKIAFAREYLNDFDTPVEGAIYEDEMTELVVKKRICPVPYDPSVPVMTWWDLGMDDCTVIWFVQRVGRELHIIDYLENNNKGLPYYIDQLNLRGYRYSSHIFPHDVRVRELIGGSRYDFLLNQIVGGQRMDVTIAPQLRVDDGIQLVRTTLPICVFDNGPNVSRGVAALKAYQTARNKNLQTNKPKPLHNWASHGADGFRTGCAGLPAVVGWSGSSVTGGLTGALKRRIRGIV